MWDIRSLSQGQCCPGKEEPGQGRTSWQSIAWSGTEGPSLGDLEKHVTQGTPWDPGVGRTGGPGPELGGAQQEAGAALGLCSELCKPASHLGVRRCQPGAGDGGEVCKWP